MSKLAIIAGTGFAQIEGLRIINSQSLKTPFGQPSSNYVNANMNGQDILFLPRHGNPQTIPPHKINYRANIWGLKALGVTDIIALAAVGGISSKMSPAHLVLPDQIIDYSYGREQTFFADDLDTVTHIDFTYPYHLILRQRLIQAANNALINISETATYGCTQGPRLESAAEIKRMERDGCDIVGMTAMPEATLAKELNLNYASIAIVANWAAGKSTGEITLSEIEHYLKQGMNDVVKLLVTFTSSP